MIAIILFIVIIIAFFYVTSNISKDRAVETLKSEGETLPVKLAAEQNVSTNIGFVEEGKVNKEKLQALTNKTYDEIKNELGIKSDFCIHFEDEGGTIILINNKTGIGSNKALINGTACGNLTG